ncbi:TetR/AcrR family transcriptional regulator [Agromyces larvae]|uniref:TetR/AcrR family transcriptional regulator n=1 Tax=Agromyces larvae TaxID=2929802 RepID=A0ABY4C295_9MICO|nr:TetR/AcrR family transcriptional regulator [Agromyces larvae]UOE45608.1 TetR/AcrR family transcriptional regulator [Agromyces larvae]
MTTERGGYAKGDRRRADIVAAAFDAFAGNGFRHASMVQIAAACGVSRAGLAHHFPSKETLLAAVLAERDRQNDARFFAGADPSRDGFDYLARLVRAVEHNATQRGIVSLFAVLSTEASDPEHPAHATFAARYDGLRRDLRDAFGELDRRGLLRDTVAVAGLESEVIALIDGLQVQWLLDERSVDMGERLRHRLGEIVRVPLP